MINIFLLNSLMSASQVEHFKVKAAVMKTLSAQETKKILKYYSTKRKYNIGVQVKVISSEVLDGSYVDKKYKKGDTLNIVISGNNKSFLQKVQKNKKLILEYNYYDDDLPKGMMVRISWTLME